MKIIQRGVDPRKQPWRGDCHLCKSVLEAERGEFKHIMSDERENGQLALALHEIVAGLFTQFLRARLAPAWIEREAPAVAVWMGVDR